MVLLKICQDTVPPETPPLDPQIIFELKIMSELRCKGHLLPLRMKEPVGTTR